MKCVGQRLVDGFPAIVVSLWAFIFASTGTILPVAHEGWWRVGAGIVAGTNLILAAFPYSDTRRFVVGVITLTWLAAWSGYLTTSLIRDDTPLAARLSPAGISQIMLVAVFVAWSYGRRPMNKVMHDMTVLTDER